MLVIQVTHKRTRMWFQSYDISTLGQCRETEEGPWSMGLRGWKWYRISARNHKRLVRVGSGGG